MSNLDCPPAWVLEPASAPKHPVSKRTAFHEANGWKCHYCGVKVVPAFTDGAPQTQWASVDHRIPRVRGGGGGDNLVTACFSCNSKKGALTEVEFQTRKLDQFDWEETRL